MNKPPKISLFKVKITKSYDLITIIYMTIRYNIQNTITMDIRNLDAQTALNELVRHGYRHTGDYGIMIDARMQANGFFRQGQPYRSVDGRVIVVQQGEMTLEIDLEEFRLRAGDIAVMMPDALVVATDIGADCLASAVIFRRLPAQAAHAKSFLLSGDDVAYARVKQYLAMIFEQFNRSTVFTDIIVHFFDALILDMLSLHTEAAATRGEGFMHRFLRLLSQEGRMKHPIDFYADRLCVSPNHMSTLVRRESGMTVLQWIDRALMREAKVLLRHTQMSIAEVADTLGFATPSAFIRFFRQQTGITPLQFRKKA